MHEQVAAGVVSVFARLYRARFPVEEMRLVTRADLRPTPPVTATTTPPPSSAGPPAKRARWSAHAYGLAVDVGRSRTPTAAATWSLPELAGAYLDRDRRRPGMVSGDVVTAAFADLGAGPGAAPQLALDLMHFSATENCFVQ